MLAGFNLGIIKRTTGSLGLLSLERILSKPSCTTLKNPHIPR